MELIGLTGKAGSGKDFVAKQVLRPLGYQNVAFAWPLKMDGMRILDLSFEEVFVTKPPYARKWLQEYGVSKRRENEDYWVDQMLNLLNVLSYEGGIDRFVITDVRFPNEVDFVKSGGGKVVRITGDRPYPLAGTPAAAHESETALDDYVAFDAEVTNNVGTTVRELTVQLARAGVIPLGEKPDPAQAELWTTAGRCCK